MTCTRCDGKKVQLGCNATQLDFCKFSLFDESD